MIDSDQSFEEEANLSKELTQEDVFVVDPLLSMSVGRTPKGKQPLTQPGSGKNNHS